MKIIREAKFNREIKFNLSFETPDKKMGYSFPCDEKGNPVLLTELHKENHQKCLGKVLTGELLPAEIEKQEISWKDDAVGLCSCGEEVELSYFTNTCECGNDYNQSGQLLCSRECWGEETGEHPADIARII